MSGVKRITVLGASGFVGSAVVAALRARNYDVLSMRAPRLPAMSPEDAQTYIASGPKPLVDLAEALADVDVVVNAAGDPDASSHDTAALYSANGLLPGLVAAACAEAGVSRFVHVSSAVVQGRLPILDESTATDAFSTYSKSKALGETLVSRFAPTLSVVYRPPSVHSVDRRVSHLISRIGSSPLSTVARPRTSPSPQALIQNVGDAVAFLATANSTPPNIVIHPWEGLTTEDVMQLLGGRRPLEIPRTVAKTTTAVLRYIGRFAPPLAANARRAEMMWLGQSQGVSWLESNGWSPPAGRDAWIALGSTIRANRSSAGQPQGERR